MIIYVDWLFNIFLKGYIGITLFPFIFVKKSVTSTTLKHEKVHLKQQKKYFVIGFYIIYLFYYFQNLIKYRKHDLAYYLIPFEKEAYVEAQGVNYYDYIIGKLKL